MPSKRGVLLWSNFAPWSPKLRWKRGAVGWIDAVWLELLTICFLRLSHGRLVVSHMSPVMCKRTESLALHWTLSRDLLRTFVQRYTYLDPISMPSHLCLYIGPLWFMIMKTMQNPAELEQAVGRKAQQTWWSLVKRHLLLWLFRLGSASGFVRLRK